MSLYAIEKTFEDNLKDSVAYKIEIPERIWPDKRLWHSFFGYKIASPIGIPACARMTGKGIELMSKFGFDVFTYKTVRSVAIPAHPLPNIAYIDYKKQLQEQDINDSVITAQSCTNLDTLCIANSFGNACPDPEWIFTDIAYARNILQEGQLLQVSVYGTEQKKRSLFDDFAYTAQRAQEAGAYVIELNLSCPNYCGDILYKNPEAVYDVVKKVTQVVTVPVIIKVGIFTNQILLSEVLRAAARAGAQGICGLNTIPMEVMNKNGRHTFGARKYAGVSGNPIRNLAQQFIKKARMYIDTQKLDLTLLATGGVLRPEHFDEFLQCGADIAMSAAGSMWRPYLAQEWHILQLSPNRQDKQLCFKNRNIHE